ncbi:hypothetical protein QVD17_15923 [Tagetes erecta]|uniref:Uncharacterized protein n=1 Tax=Tagetes erecta TaxID=13708 RepID=A0AAD8KWV7_TARER|nr:hypothetical protein QVD17_15923 [Tagetes erecta]
MVVKTNSVEVNDNDECEGKVFRSAMLRYSVMVFFHSAMLRCSVMVFIWRDAEMFSYGVFSQRDAEMFGYGVLSQRDAEILTPTPITFAPTYSRFSVCSSWVSWIFTIFDCFEVVGSALQVK